MCVSAFVLRLDLLEQCRMLTGPRDFKIMRNSTICVSDQVRRKPACTNTENSKKLQISIVTRRGILLSVSRSENRDADAVTAQLICVFVFAFAGCWFSHAAAHLICFAHTQQDFIFNRIQSDQSAHLRNKTNSYRDESIGRWGENRSTRGKTT